MAAKKGAGGRARGKSRRSGARTRKPRASDLSPSLMADASGIDDVEGGPAAAGVEGAGELPELDAEARDLASRTLEEMARGVDGAGAGVSPGARDDAEPAVLLSASDGALSFDELREMVSMLAWGTFALLPKGIGGGELTDKEERFLGKMWARVLARRLTGPDVDIYLAIVATVETLTKRAMAARIEARQAAPVTEGSDNAER